MKERHAGESELYRVNQPCKSPAATRPLPPTSAAQRFSPPRSRFHCLTTQVCSTFLTLTHPLDYLTASIGYAGFEALQESIANVQLSASGRRKRSPVPERTSTKEWGVVRERREETSKGGRFWGRVGGMQ